MLLSTPLEVVANAPPPVIVEAYTESLCIDCKNFFLNSLLPAYDKLGPAVIDLRVVPFGNAELDLEHKTVACQHGEAECDANLWQQCAVRQTKAPTYLKFFECLEKSLPMGHRDDPFEESKFSECAKVAGLDFDDLSRCHRNPVLAWMLQKENSDKTPSHQSVPWVFINDKFYNDGSDDFLGMVCTEYLAGGGSHPACPSTSTMAGLN
eukprot:scaffold517_cov119-Cylindrotheca_fusiformis.AAC.8